MIKNKYIHGFSVVEWEKGKAFMLQEVYGAYNTELVIWRFVLTRFTFLNEWRHKLMHTFLTYEPKDIYKKPNLI